MIDCFIIVEIGFGIGLNFFCVVMFWYCSLMWNKYLYFISVEKFFLLLVDMIFFCVKYL